MESFFAFSTVERVDCFPPNCFFNSSTFAASILENSGYGLPILWPPGNNRWKDGRLRYITNTHQILKKTHKNQTCKLDTHRTYSGLTLPTSVRDVPSWVKTLRAVSGMNGAINTPIKQDILQERPITVPARALKR